MTAHTVSLSWLLTGGILTLITVILMLYVYLSNPRQPANQVYSLSALIFAISGFAALLAYRANTASQGLPALMLFAASAPACAPTLLWVILSLFKPQWVSGRMRWVGWLFFILCLLPVGLVLADWLAGTGMYLTLPIQASYSGGSLAIEELTAGIFGSYFVPLWMGLFGLLSIVFLAYLAIFDRRLDRTDARLARVLALLTLVSLLLGLNPLSFVPTGVTWVLMVGLLAIGYGSAVIRQMTLHRTWQSGPLQVRLTLLVLSIAVPVMVFIALFMLGQADDLLAGNAGAKIELRNITLVVLVLGGGVLFAMIAFTLRQTMRPIGTLTKTVTEIASGDLTRMAQVESEDEFGTLAKAFNSMTLQVRELITSLERRVAERTLDLEHRSAQLQASAEIGRAAATIRNLNELLPLATRLISERFGFYHVGVFLLDESKSYAVLRAANSEGGQRMLARGHRLMVGKQGIVGYVCDQREPRIASSVGEDAVYFSNPDLPNTQSEMALPLMVGTELLGALDVQSEDVSAFSEEDIRTMQVLADQVAIAIHSAQVVSQLEQVIEAERRAYTEISQRAWQVQANVLDNRGFSRTPAGIIPLRELADKEMIAASERNVAYTDEQDRSLLYVPVQVRGVKIGVMKLRRAGEEENWAEDEIQMVEKLAEQLGVSLDSARVYQTTQANIRRERMLTEVSSRIRQSLDIDSILRTTSQEVRRVMGLPKLTIRLGNLPEKVLKGGTVKAEPDGQATSPPQQDSAVDRVDPDRGGSHE